MRKDVNVTVRVPESLKREAEVAAELLDITLSQVVRMGFIQLCRDAARERRRREVEGLRQEVHEEAMAGRARAPARTDQGQESTALTRQQRRAIEREQAKKKGGRS